MLGAQAWSDELRLKPSARPPGAVGLCYPVGRDVARLPGPTTSGGESTQYSDGKERSTSGLRDSGGLPRTVGDDYAVGRQVIHVCECRQIAPIEDGVGGQRLCPDRRHTRDAAPRGR